MESNAIVVVESDHDDFQMLEQAAHRCRIANRLVHARSGKELIRYLKDAGSPPFLILCAVNLPGDNGFQIRDSLSRDAELKYKSVPFIFWSERTSEADVQRAYDMQAQGYFFKPNDFDSLCTMFTAIVRYWSQSRHPKRIGPALGESA